MSTPAAPATTPRIAIFDSGLGGISIYDVIRQQFPQASLAYCSDNEAFPYGTKTEAELIGRVSAVLTQFNKITQPDILVIACNTASTVVLPSIRMLIKQPVIGVVPAIKPAASLAGGTHIGLLATPGTVQRRYTQDLINQFAAGFHWVKVGSSELVQLAEKKMYGETIGLDDIAMTISGFSGYSVEQLDTIVLGCTHFPLLKTELQQVMPGIRHWIDSSLAIANRVSFWLHELGFYENEKTSLIPSHQIFFTGKIASEKALQPLINSRKFSGFNYLKV